MVADIVAYHPTVKHYIKFLGTTVGRDKLMRTVQYFARFYAWYLFRTNGTPSEVAPWETIKKQLSMMRKVLRIGKNVEHLRAAAEAADGKGAAAADPVLRYAAVGRQLGYAAYLTFDMCTVLDVTGVRKYAAAKRFQREAYRMWAVGLVFSVAAQMYTLHQLSEREARVADRKDGESAVESKTIAKERSKSRLQLISDLCDLTVPTAALSWLLFDDGIVGLAGTVSSLVGVYNQWNSTA